MGRYAGGPHRARGPVLHAQPIIPFVNVASALARGAVNSHDAYPMRILRSDRTGREGRCYIHYM